MDIKDIQNLIKFVAKSGANEVKLEMEDVKITIKTGKGDKQTIVQTLPAQQQSIVQSPIIEKPLEVSTIEQVSEVEDESSKYITIKSPIIGTFYRKPSPDKSNFVEVDSSIAEGDILCVIEAMKLFNEIESEVTGKIVKILIDDASPVEFDQPLFLVDPS
ncbi:acetyl-CoA carboxylase biotin carboxyl carrier protein [Flavobacteriaceae bacterium]|jgi:acetyl-CoA carboxylase biotin carboxyl carrier protein|nr:acetyl-CoA carboxylase biotin carboxyl carrier protein [Flavobacteriaceae bacterium]MDA9573129.1 acetyl-CoA carboxylase biotin carboxyl carrier protein [Flavobacteriaceae bacterium]MDB4212831.1 acetyl-CoA carboxylase biotin carboxyl carrier protein [Flavobacteriaceae bacterium]MDC0552486.1 acetyl-CoA carboxylase biotin carboxyl carrier protein [Flavobacteriaceae bacterium]MDC1320686.1 acetyl-CoA carboxylase biotin carboxyl carrier protein [Flavobacteriaceae bacterium]|tara:strand:+ start:337 stop:816 length:480 start_codon:yes stop_codon:yes gene_type:complete